MKQYCNDNSPINVIEEILEDASLVEIDNTWVLLYKDREYMRLLDAKSREDAEEQIASMLFLRDAIGPSLSPENQSAGDTSECERSATPTSERIPTSTVR